MCQGLFWHWGSPGVPGLLNFHSLPFCPILKISVSLLQTGSGNRIWTLRIPQHDTFETNISPANMATSYR